MRAFLGPLYQGLQAVSAFYVFATLTFRGPAPAAVPVAPEAVPTAAAIPAVETTEPAAPEVKPAKTAQTEPEAPKPPERPKGAIGFNIPEGQFQFDPAAAGAVVAPKVANADPEPFPFAPPEAAPEPAAQAAPPLIYRRGRMRGPMHVVRNPWSDPTNLAFNNRGDAGRARAFAFDDRPEPGFRGLGNMDPASVLKSWKHDIEEYRVLSSQGRGEEDLKQRLGDKYPSVHWAASLDVSLDELPTPTDSYITALSREHKQARR